MTTFNFDIPADILASDLFDILNTYNFTIIKIIPIGPAGGNPNITVSADISDIEKFKLTYN